ncbi:Kruppel-related zinc finger protein [Anopheles sinensis]|uniref:Kruppel-related zinc finger protein n=1 Tax=Anopheles sinensis TaxID=74873 RepID=A0A084VVW9_ANOSI|nr:Kruppel-related zinc finger protein [Anopheles sinensis]
MFAFAGAFMRKHTAHLPFNVSPSSAHVVRPVVQLHQKLHQSEPPYAATVFRSA